MNAPRAAAIAVIARSVLIEALRRRELHVILLLGLALATTGLAVDFFDLGGWVKFYRELALNLMSLATAIAVVLLATRQLPREFEQRTIYPLLARPISRAAFLTGKALGVVAAALVCYALFFALYVIGMLYLGGDIGWALILQHLYLQLWHMLLLTAACFLLSLCFSSDAAVVIGLLLYLTSNLLSHITLSLYPLTNALGRVLLQLFTYLLPQLTLFDLSAKALHQEYWPPLDTVTMLALTAYALVYTLLYSSAAYLLFRRKPL
jgi:ABC-type transport system involved in multi-copper enzyme maturation permease subunit